MLIYNQNKEFVGIDDEDLRLLGFSSLNDLLARCSDIAELFVKRPGYIHDFKNFQWIDFVMHADADVSRAIIRTGEKEFSCEIIIRPFHLTQSPDDEAFAISLQHIQPLGLSIDEAPTQSYSKPPASEPKSVAPSRPGPSTTKITAPSNETTTLTEEFLSHDETSTLPDIPEEPLSTLNEMIETDLHTQPEEEYSDLQRPLDIEDDIFLQEEPAAEVGAEPFDEPALVTTPVSPQEQGYISKLETSPDYVFDPHVAADELGLPVDLIEEFIRDFIQQAHDFHGEIFESSAKEDFDNVKILSHKLKGVAANLRVEDAFEVLAIINSSHDQTEIDTYLKVFYESIARLEGKEVPTAKPTSPPSIPAELDLPPVSEETPDISPQEPQESLDNDIYAFDILDSTPHPEPEKELPSSEEDDLYALEELTAESTYVPPKVEASESLEDDGLYPFESLDKEIADQESPTETDDEHVLPPMDMSLLEELDNEPVSQEELSVHTPDKLETDDEYELPPMDMSLLDTLDNDSLKQEIPSNQSLDDFGIDEEYELPPMDIHQHDDEEPSQEPGPVVQTLPTLHFDAQKAADELGLDIGLINELTQEFANDADRLKSEFEVAILSLQSSNWQTTASQLKGVADNLRMQEIATTLQSLTQMTDPEQAEQMMHQLYSYVDQL